MKKHKNNGWRGLILGGGASGLSLNALAQTSLTSGGEAGTNWAAIIMFLLFVGGTAWITKWAAGKTKSAADFYTAGGGITSFQNGLAIAGDYMSAASFLGISALVFANGFDGLIFSIGWLVGWPILTFLMAERIRNLGRFTFADVASFRFSPPPIRAFLVYATLVVVIFYMIAQMVGAGQLIRTLFGLQYDYAIILVGVLMMCYVLFGGMTATTWVQIVKAVMLLSGATFIALAVLWEFNMNPAALFEKAVEVHPKGANIMAPGGLIKDPVSAISVGIALMFGTAGLPHILNRFFTVADGTAARNSVAWATGWIGYFYILTFVIGFGAIVFVGTSSQYLDPATGTLIGSNNMAAVHLSHALGGNLLLGFICAVAFATIIAVVAGLTLSGAAALSHDIYSIVLKQGDADPVKELRVSRITAVIIGITAIFLGIAFEKENVAYMVMLAFAVACSTNFPVLVMSIFWKDCTTKGATLGGFVGLIAAVTMTVLSEPVWVKVLGHSKAIFPFASPALFSMSMAFFTIWLVSTLDQSPHAEREREDYPDQLTRSETGFGASTASDH